MPRWVRCLYEKYWAQWLCAHSLHTRFRLQGHTKKLHKLRLLFWLFGFPFNGNHASSKKNTNSTKKKSIGNRFLKPTKMPASWFPTEWKELFCRLILMGVVSKVVRACDSDIPFPVKRKSFGFYFCPALNLSIRNFSTIPYTALLHGTVDLAYFLQTFRRHFFQNAYFTKVLQINTEHFSHALTTVWNSTTMRPSHVQALIRQ